MKIVSGRTGSPHVTSHEFRQIIEGSIGKESCILKSGDNLEPELVSNNLIKIKSGMMAHHGNVSSVEYYDEVELNNGTQGMKRIDLIVNRYTRNDETKIENNSWICIMGTPHASSPLVPSHIVGNLQSGDLIDDCPFLEIHYDGINVTEVKKLLEVVPTNKDLSNSFAELNGKMSEKGATASIGKYGSVWNLSASYKSIAGNEIRNTNKDVFECKSNALFVKKPGYYFVSAQTNCFSDDGSGTIWMKVVKNSSGKETDQLASQSYVYKGYATVDTQGVIWCEAGDFLNILVSASITSGTIKCSGQDNLTLIKL